ncbi:MAG: M20/M25/M40 family metallo-hydrolase [Planctomycetota bacterium]
MTGSPNTLSETEAAVRDAIEARRSLLLADLRAAVETPTGPGSGDGIERQRAFFADRLADLGATHERVAGEPRPSWMDQPETPPDASLFHPQQGHGPRVLIAGHLDTVHHVDSGFDRLHLRDDGTATGPGCVDMKGGLVIALHAIETLHELALPVNWSFFLNTDEETGTYHSDAALRRVSEAHDLGIALEPALAGGELAIERVGSGQFMVEVFGRSAHVGRAFQDGVSAVSELARIVAELAAVPEPARGKILNVGPLQGGAATNAVPDYAAAWGNVRFPNAVVERELAETLESYATAQDAMPRVAIHRSFNRPAKPLIPATESLALQARRVAEALGQQLPFAKTGGVCDGNIMQDAGLPTIDTLGVRGGGLHTPDEWIELESLVERCQLLAVLLARLSQQ